MTIVSAAYSAVPSFAATAAPRGSADEDGSSGEQFASQLSGLTAPAADAPSPRRVAVTSTMLSSVSPLHSSPAGDSGSDAQFASHLGGLTAGPADADAWRSAGPANLPKTARNDTPVSQTSAVTPVPPDDAKALRPSTEGDPGSKPQSGELTVSPLTALPAVVQSTPQHRTPLAVNAKTNTQKAAAGQSLASKALRRDGSGEAMQTPVVAPSPAPPPETATMLPAVAEDLIENDGPDTRVEAAAPHSAPATAAEPAEPTVTAAAGQTQSLPEMAFAARIQPVQSVNHTTLSAEMASAAAVASASKKVVPAADGENTAPAGAPGLLANITGTVERNAEPNRTQLPAAPLAANASHAETPTSAADSLPKAAAPLKDISLQVSQPGKERVDVRVVQQGGEVHVSVHSGDASLNSGLRQGLSELQSRLEENGYRSETWRPGASAAAPAPAPAGQASANQSRNGDGQAQQGGSQQDSGRRNQNQSNQPRWVEELESSLAPGEKSSGGFYGFSS